MLDGKLGLVSVLTLFLAVIEIFHSMVIALISSGMGRSRLLCRKGASLGILDLVGEQDYLEAQIASSMQPNT